MIAEVERLFPDVERVVGGADFGRDAMSKAKRIVEATRAAIERTDTEAVKEQVEQLQRTERMFKGVVARS